MKKIKIYDTAFAHEKYSSDFQKSKYIEWTRNNDQTAPPVFYTEKNAINKTCDDPKNNFAWLLEPEAFYPDHYELITANNLKFEKVFTYSKKLLDLTQNFCFYPFGGCWIPEHQQQLYQKSKLVSIIASSKKFLPGHILRHEVIEHYNNYLDIYGRRIGADEYKFNNPINYKIDGLRDYMFSIAIENNKTDYYFTEKLIDCFVTGTIPIYYGCPSIEKFFNVDGMIIVDSLQDFSLLKHLNADTFYSKSDAIKENFELAKKYVLSEDWIFENYFKELLF